MEELVADSIVAKHPTSRRRDELLAEVSDAVASSNLRFWTFIDRVRMQVQIFLDRLHRSVQERTSQEKDTIRMMAALTQNLQDDARLRDQAQHIADAIDRFNDEYANAAIYIVRRVMMQENVAFNDAVQRAALHSTIVPPELDIVMDEPIVFATNALKQAMLCPDVNSGLWFASRDMAARNEAIKHAVLRALMSSASGDFRIASTIERRREMYNSTLQAPPYSAQRNSHVIAASNPHEATRPRTTEATANHRSDATTEATRPPEATRPASIPSVAPSLRSPFFGAFA